MVKNDILAIYTAKEMSIRLSSMAVEIAQLRVANEDASREITQLQQANNLLKKQLKEGEKKNASATDTNHKQNKQK